jgi:hypothetical protein
VNGGRVLLETHCLDWPEMVATCLGAEGAYGKIVRVELLHKLHDELKYDSLDALTTGIAKDCDARAYFASRATQTHTPRPGARPRATEFEGARPAQPAACPEPLRRFATAPPLPRRAWPGQARR